MSFVPLIEVAEVQLGKMLSPKSKTGSSYFRYLRNTNVQWGRLDLADLAQMDFSEVERRKFELRDGDAKTTIAHLPQVRLEQLQIPEVDVQEQRRIAARLKAQLAEVEVARRAAAAQLAQIDQLPQKLLAQAFNAPGEDRP